ncbi:hypothetical protein [Pseudomonas sp. 5P_3.1_Bac2]|uniref:hypothetical protein n=1 Tax=Pseudomonas sp. 5P_3.1_Bac2 TaxID=2971617 RepID=UPI0021C81316|nr:hypothetical protein [Pseudomonas sp. 5P_3.1_Bac2]MCU1719167.1 hypothetical protein [Pseudomonas sp. 5P_3.1_Bac2]
MGLQLNQAALVEAVFHGFVSAAEIRQWLAQIDALLARQEDFYFIASTREHSDFAEDYRAIQAVWYKQYKNAFRQYCRGIVRIAHDPAEQARLDTPALHAAWGVPYAVTLERSAAYQWVMQQMLVQHAAA